VVSPPRLPPMHSPLPPRVPAAARWHPMLAPSMCSGSTTATVVVEPRFNRSSQHLLSAPLAGTGPASRQAFASQASSVAWC